MERETKKLTLSLTSKCWSSRYKCPVSFTCGGCHPDEFIAAWFFNFKRMAKNYDNNNKINDTNNKKLSSFINFHRHNLY